MTREQPQWLLDNLAARDHKDRLYCTLCAVPMVRHETVVNGYVCPDCGTAHHTRISAAFVRWHGR